MHSLLKDTDESSRKEVHCRDDDEEDDLHPLVNEVECVESVKVLMICIEAPDRSDGEVED